MEQKYLSYFSYNINYKKYKSVMPILNFDSYYIFYMLGFSYIEFL